jgi:cytochrome c oxidase cbb3-type subunit 1
LIRAHFWGSGYGMGLQILMMILAGFWLGGAWSDASPDNTPAAVVYNMLPYAIGRTFSWLLLALAHGLFFLHFLAMLFRLGQPSGEPTLFAPIEEGGKKA